MSSPSRSDSDDEGPFLVNVFHRLHSLYGPKDFENPSLPPPVAIYTWGHCTLDELAMELAEHCPGLLPRPSIGTRLVFQLVYVDEPSHSNPDYLQTYVTKDLGTTVIGHGMPGVELSADDTDDLDGDKTLDDARFVIGDYISCAVLPPLGDGSVAHAESAKRGEAIPGTGSLRHSGPPRDNGPQRYGGRGGRPNDRNGPGHAGGNSQRDGNWPTRRSSGRGRW